MTQPVLALTPLPNLLAAEDEATKFLVAEGDQYVLSRDDRYPPLPNPLQGLWLFSLEPRDAGSDDLIGRPSLAVSADGPAWVSAAPHEPALIGLVYPKEEAEPDALTAAGFNEAQVRVPKGNGKLSGRWVDSPLSIVRALNALDGGYSQDVRDRLGWAERSAEEVQDDFEFDGPDRLVDRLGDVVLDLQEAIDVGRLEGDDAAPIETAIEKIRGLSDIDWSLFASESDLGYGDDDDDDDESVARFDWESLSHEETLAATATAVAELQAAMSSASEPEIEEAARAAQAGMAARITDTLRDAGLPNLTIRSTTSSAEWDGQTVTLSWGLFDEDGGRVGQIERYIGETHVENSYFTIDKSLQGNGFGTRLTRTLLDWYRDNSVERVTVHANIDVGGFTWARQGFDWDHEHMSVSEFVGSAVADLAYQLDGEGGLPPQVNSLWSDWVLNIAGESHLPGFDETREEDIEAVLSAVTAVLPDWDPEPTREDALGAYSPADAAETLLDGVWQALVAADRITFEEIQLRDTLVDWAGQVRDREITVTPYDIASFGQGAALGTRIDQQTIFDEYGPAGTKPVETWLGKRTLLYSDWYGEIVF